MKKTCKNMACACTGACMQAPTYWHLQANEQGVQFWDTYLHIQCRLLMSQDFSPFPVNSIT